MKYKIKFTTTFKKDYKLAVKRGINIDKLKYVIEILSSDNKLDIKYKDHKLINDKNYNDLRRAILNLIGYLYIK